MCCVAKDRTCHHWALTQTALPPLGRGWGHWFKTQWVCVIFEWKGNKKEEEGGANMATNGWKSCFFIGTWC